MKRDDLLKWAVAGVFGVGMFMVGGVSALAEDVFVKQATVIVRAGKGAAYDEVAKVKKGDKLTVIAREDKWIKVKAGDKEGYIFETATSASNPGDGGGLSKLLAGASGSSAASSAEAGKGLGESLEFAKAQHMDPSGLNRLIALRKTVSGKEWEAFTAEGKVGPAK